MNESKHAKHRNIRNIYIKRHQDKIPVDNRCVIPVFNLVPFGLTFVRDENTCMW